MIVQTNYFLQTLEHLRNYEEVLLYANLLEITSENELEAVEFLRKEFEHEKINYACKIGQDFDSNAALWAAKTIYISAQLMLYRENKDAELEILLPSYQLSKSASSQLSADLVLRFLPDIITHLKMINPEDSLISILEHHLIQWHFSGIKYALNAEDLDFSFVTVDPCLTQLYVDRVIEYKRISLAKHSALINGVKSSLGMFAAVYWKDFEQFLISENGSC